MDLNKYNIELIVLVKSKFDLNTHIKTTILYEKENEFLFRKETIEPSEIIYESDVIISYSCIVTANYVSNLRGNFKKYAFLHGEFCLNHQSYTKEYLIDIYSNIDKIVCVSDFVKQSTELYLGDMIRNKLIVIYNPIDIDKIKEKSKNNITKDKFTILTIGRLSKEKCIDQVIKLHKRLLEENIENKLQILGEGDLREYLEELIINLDIEKSCELIGYVKNPYSYITNCDLFILLSTSEGLPLCVMEAMVLNKTIVTSDIQACKELLGDMGITIDTKTDFYNDVKEIILNSEARNKYAKLLENNQSFRFDKKIVISELEELFDRAE